MNMVDCIEFKEEQLSYVKINEILTNVIYNDQDFIRTSGYQK